MSYETHLLDNKKERKWFSRLLKLIFILSACFLVMILVLANMGGSSDALKGSVEDFISGLSKGRPVQVGVLNRMSFFPRVGVDAQNIHILASEEHDYPMVHIGKAQIFMNFWDVAFGGSKVLHFYVENVYAIKGVFGQNDFSVERVFIDHDIEQGSAYLKGNGKVGVHSWSFSSDLDVHGAKGSYKFSLPQKFSFVLDLADIHVDANFINHEDAYFKIENANITMAEKSISLNTVLSAAGRQLLKFRGDVSTSTQEKIAFDLLLDRTSSIPKVSGDITSDKVSFEGQGDISMIYQRFKEIFGYKRSTPMGNKAVSEIFGHYDLNLNVDFKSVSFSSIAERGLRFPLIREHGNLRIGPMLDGTQTRVPLITVVPVEPGGASVLVMQEGTLDLRLLSVIFPNRSKRLDKRNSVDVSCGLLVLGNVEESGQPIEFMAITSQNMQIYSPDKLIPNSGTLSDITLSAIFKKPKFPIVSLPNQQYSFVQGSLQGAMNKEDCAKYIQKIEDVHVPKDKVEAK